MTDKNTIRPPICNDRRFVSFLTSLDGARFGNSFAGHKQEYLKELALIMARYDQWARCFDSSDQNDLLRCPKPEAYKRVHKIYVREMHATLQQAKKVWEEEDLTNESRNAGQLTDRSQDDETLRQNLRRTYNRSVVASKKKWYFLELDTFNEFKEDITACVEKLEKMLPIEKLKQSSMEYVQLLESLARTASVDDRAIFGEQPSPRGLQDAARSVYPLLDEAIRNAADIPGKHYYSENVVGGKTTTKFGDRFTGISGRDIMTGHSYYRNEAGGESNARFGNTYECSK